jgi:hypothetical protein
MDSGIEFLGCRSHWTSPLCEIRISRLSVYQMVTSGEQARGEDDFARANFPRRKAGPMWQESQWGLAHRQSDRKLRWHDARLVR